ncbi:unnamed protein product, partial [Allacma fusca]
QCTEALTSDLSWRMFGRNSFKPENDVFKKGPPSKGEAHFCLFFAHKRKACRTTRSAESPLTLKWCNRRKIE